jgi:hypothetical protein
MGNRTCPLCFTRVPRTLVLVHTYDMECPACHAALEVSRRSRVIAALAGLVVEFVAVRFVDRISETAEWSLQVLAGCVAFGVVTAAWLFLSADLVVRPKPEVPASHRASGFPHAHA